MCSIYTLTQRVSSKQCRIAKTHTTFNSVVKTSLCCKKKDILVAMNIPSKSEVFGWNSESLADYLRKMRLSGCDTVVRRNGINGAMFLKMSGSDLQKFPKIHVPLITKICNEINQDGKKKGLFQRSKPPQYPNQGYGQKHETLDSDDTDDDYEEPDVDKCEDNYICAVSEGFNPEGEEDNEDNYELPPSETPNKIPSHFRTAKPLDDGEYIDSIRATRDSTKSPPQRPDSSSLLSSNAELLVKAPRPLTPITKSKSTGAAPLIDRRNKPRLPAFYKTAPEISEGGEFHTSSKNAMRSFFPEEQNLVQNSQMEQDLDPQWYVGRMSRGVAEGCLRQINMDGAFLIRDSSKNSTDQPYTLMVLNKQKVYNIQIRFHRNEGGFSLGTGISGAESFPSVRDMVTHHTKSYLILIDAMERGTGPQHQCCLIHPARR